jgi:hypothetical protein
MPHWRRFGRAPAPAVGACSGVKWNLDRREKALVSAMTRYSRSVIPGRPNGEGSSHDVDSLVFGRKGRSGAAAANDEDDDGDSLSDGEAGHLLERASTDRRKGGRRRKSEYAPLPQEGRGYRAPQEGSKRGPVLLVGALIVVGVFSVVVWNAYRDGVRPEDSAATPVLAEAGAFKTKPDAGKATGNVEASVFEQVEAPKAAIIPAPEVRESAFVLPPRTPGVTPSALAAATPAPAPATAAPLPSTIAAKPPVQTAAVAAKPTPAPPKPVVAAAKPTTTQAPAVTPAPPPATAAVPPPLQSAAAPAPKSEAIQLAGAYAPSFATDGKYIVQVAAASTEAAANAEWAKRAKAAPDLFGAAEKFVVQADVNGRTVYRLRVGSFATSAEADAFCTAYKAKGGACFRTAK